MALLPITPVSPDLTLIKPVGASETRLGPIPNVGDGIPGLGGIGSVEMPGTGILTAPSGGFTVPDITGASSASSSSASSSSGFPAPEVTPFPLAAPAPTSTPIPAASPAPFPVPGPAPSALPTPTSISASASAQTGAQSQAQTGAQLQQPQTGSPYVTTPITTDQTPALLTTPVTGAASPVPVKDTPLAQTFGKYLKDAAGNYSDVQNQADSMIQRLASGEKVDIHDVSLALQKASLTNQLAIQVRNRLVESYQEIMRMQM